MKVLLITFGMPKLMVRFISRLAKFNGIYMYLSGSIRLYIMKASILFVLSIVTLIGCSDTSSSPNNSEATSEYYPLEVGNTWKYVVLDNVGDTIDVYSLKVEATEVLNMRKYFKISNSSERLKRAVTYSYQRVDKDRVYTFDNYFENLTIDFTNSDSTAGYVYGVTDSIGTAIGTFNNVNLVKTADSEFDSESYAPKLGLIFRAQFGKTSEIVYAKIGDKIYK